MSTCNYKNLTCYQVKNKHNSISLNNLLFDFYITICKLNYIITYKIKFKISKINFVVKDPWLL